jgi:hypothetical protein
MRRSRRAAWCFRRSPSGTIKITNDPGYIEAVSLRIKDWKRGAQAREASTVLLAEKQARLLAFAMGWQGRLGEASPVRWFDPEVLRLVLEAGDCN